MPIPTEFGSPITAVVRSIVNNVPSVRVRELPSTSARIIGALKVGDTLAYRIPKVTYMADGNRWAYTDTHKGWFSLDVLALVTVASAPPKIVPNVPYVTQQGVNASRRVNDCGVACVLMLLRHTLILHNMQPMPAITVDRMTLDTRQLNQDIPLLPNDLTSLMTAYGMRGTVVAAYNYTIQRIKSEVDAGRPSIALLNRKILVPTENVGGHYVVVYGYSDSQIVYHDPWKTTGESTAEIDLFDRALKNEGTLNMPYQGVVMA